MSIFSYKRHINNWRQDTAHLTLEQRGAYSELCDWFYSTNGYLPADIKKIYRLLGVQSQSERTAIAEVIKMFFEEKNGFLYQNGCVKVLKAIHEKSEKARLSAEAKYNKNNNLNSANAPANAPANAVLTINHKPYNHIKEPPLSPFFENGEKKDAKPKRRKPSVSRPADWQPDFKHLEFARSNGIDIDREQSKFCNYHDSKGSLFADWNAAFRNWLNNAAEYRARDVARESSSGKGTASVVDAAFRAREANAARKS